MFTKFSLSMWYPAGLFEKCSIGWELDLVSALKDLWCSFFYSCLSLIDEQPWSNHSCLSPDRSEP